MNDSYICAVCGHSVDPGDDHVKVEKQHVKTTDPDGGKEYLLHVDCSRAVFDGWREPA